MQTTLPVYFYCRIQIYWVTWLALLLALALSPCLFHQCFHSFSFVPLPLTCVSCTTLPQPGHNLINPGTAAYIRTDFQVDFLLMGVPELLGSLGFLWDIWFLGILYEVWVVFPSQSGMTKGGGKDRVAITWTMQFVKSKTKHFHMQAPSKAV